MSGMICNVIIIMTSCAIMYVIKQKHASKLFIIKRKFKFLTNMTFMSSCDVKKVYFATHEAFHITL